MRARDCRCQTPSGDPSRLRPAPPSDVSRRPKSLRRHRPALDGRDLEPHRWRSLGFDRSRPRRRHRALLGAARRCLRGSRRRGRAVGQDAGRCRARQRTSVIYRDGAADSIPAPTASSTSRSCRWSSTTFRTAACARSSTGSSSTDGRVFIRNTFSGRLEGIRHYEFFPLGPRAIDEARLPTDRVREAFEARDSRSKRSRRSSKKSTRAFAAHYDRIKRRRPLSFELISDAEFDQGLQTHSIAAAHETTPTPILEKIDLLVLRRQLVPPSRARNSAAPSRPPMHEGLLAAPQQAPA